MIRPPPRSSLLPYTTLFRSVFALYNFVCGFFSIGLMATVAVILHSPFIFPSLGPTAFHYFSRQTAPSASPDRKSTRLYSSHQIISYAVFFLINNTIYHPYLC